MEGLNVFQFLFISASQHEQVTGEKKEKPVKRQAGGRDLERRLWIKKRKKENKAGGHEGSWSRNFARRKSADTESSEEDLQGEFIGRREWDVHRRGASPLVSIFYFSKIFRDVAANYSLCTPDVFPQFSRFIEFCLLCNTCLFKRSLNCS